MSTERKEEKKEAEISGKQSTWLAVPQKRLGIAGLIAFLALANLLVPFSVDIYTPSLPEMPGYFHVSESIVNLTLVLFYIFFAVALLLFGTLSDKTGRKIVLVVGNIVYVAGSVACAFSYDIAFLITARVVQALGAGAVYAVATALVSDCFTEQKRVGVLTIMQVLFVIGPILAPLLGGIIILFGTWREVFLVLAALGAVCLIGSLLFSESLGRDKRMKVGVFKSLLSLGVVLKNKQFIMVLMVMSLFNLMFMAYVAAGSYIYVDSFGQTQQVFTYFFAATAAIASLGPVAFQKFGKNVDLNKFTYLLIVVSGISGICLITIGHLSVWLFVVLCIVFCATTMTMRPYTINMMLAMSEDKAGAASSMLNFVSTVLGSVGMVAVMLFSDLVFGLGVVVLACMILSVPFWAIYVKGTK